MNLRRIITGSDPEDEETSSRLGLPPYRRWYCYGWRSPGILIARLRNAHAPIYRLRLAWQRAARGYDDTALWSLNYELAKLTVAGCRYMREAGHGYPSEFSEDFGDGRGWDAWEEILRKIEDGFQAWIDEDGHFFDKPEEEAKFKEGMALYGEWFGALWD